ncbi:MAG: hypothetical protein FWC98_01195 [Bacteroidales bacterium]|nr:hypothetical protein [Bacteroidales bacterium]
MVDYLNTYYFLYLALGFVLLVGLYVLLRNKSKKTITIVLFSFLLGNFILNFLKLFADFYQAWMPIAIRTITPENICTISVLAFPWLFLSKVKILKDYMFYMGIMGGLGAMLIPVDAIGLAPFAFETIWFYISHGLVWIIPLLMVLLKLHTLDYKRIIKIPLLVYAVLCIILVNEVILIGAGFVNINTLFSYEIRNPAMIFGPLPEDLFIGKLFTPLTPNLFLTIPIGPNAGAPFYWPILWLVIPFFIYFCILAFILALPFEYKTIQKDVFALKRKLRLP